MVQPNYLVIFPSWENTCLSEMKAICVDIKKKHFFFHSPKSVLSRCLCDQNSWEDAKICLSIAKDLDEQIVSGIFNGPFDFGNSDVHLLPWLYIVLINPENKL